MVFLWAFSNKKSGEKEYFLQFFPQDKKYPIDRGMATEIFAGYEYNEVNMPESNAGSESASDRMINVYEIREEPPLLIHEMLDQSDFAYKLRFSFSGMDIDVSKEFLYIFQSACNLEPVDPEGHKYGRIKKRYFTIQPKKRAYITLE